MSSTSTASDVSSKPVSTKGYSAQHSNGTNGSHMLSHLQELRQWQDQNRQNFRNVNEEHWKQLKFQDEKVNTLFEQNRNRTPWKDRDEMKNSGSGLESTTGNRNIPHSQAQAFDGKKKGPFQFLRRGEGLKRFQPDSARERAKMQPHRRKSDISSSHMNSEIDNLPRHLIRKLKLLPENRSPEVILKCNNDKDGQILNLGSSKFSASDSRNIVKDTEDSLLDKRKEEMEELVEFEILEKVASNCSFDSDSSLVNRLLQRQCSKNTDSHVAEPKGTIINDRPTTKVPIHAELKKEDELYTPIESQPSTSGIQTRMPLSEDDNDDDDWVDASSDEEIGIPLTRSLGHHALCTESGNDIHKPRNIPIPETISREEAQFDDETSWKDGSETLEEVVIITDSEDDTEVTKVNNPQPSMTQNPVSSMEIKGLVSSGERQLLQKRLKELEDEIANFRKENELLARLRNQHEVMIQLAKREREAIAREKEEYKRKLDQELAMEKKKMRRQLQNCTKIQKQKEVPSSQENTTTNSVIQALKQEMQKQATNWLATNGRLRARLTSVEAERNKLKAECHRLEIQKKQLHAALKEKQPVKPHPSAFVSCSIKSVVQKPVAKKQVKRQSKSTANVLSTVENKMDGEEILKESSKETNDMQWVQEQETEKIPVPSDHISVEKPCDTGKMRVRFMLESEDQQNGNEDGTVVQEVRHSDKTEKIFDNGEREIHYASGSRKVISGDGRTVTVYYYNGDVKISLQDGTEIYYYASSGTKQTVYPDGVEILEFPSGQEERHYKDGTKHITLSNGTVHIIHMDGTEEVSSPDGTVQVLHPDGSKVLQFVSGEREIHTNAYKRREYPDGTVKILHSDGRLETRFSSGRYRLKDGDGNLLVDTKYVHLRS